MNRLSLFVQSRTIELFFFLLIIFSTVGDSFAKCKPSSSHIPERIVGLQLFFPDEAAWARAADLNVQWLRIEIRWDQLEPEEDQYKWEVIKETLTLARQSGNNIMLLVNHVPDWAMASPDPAVRFGKFLRALYRAYPAEMSAIKFIEVLNEPNHPGYGWSRTDLTLTDSANQFAAFLRAANIAIRHTAPDAVLISGGLSPDGFKPADYMRAVFAQDIANCIDVFAYHPYGAEGRLLETQINIENLLASLKVKLPVWFTEYGTNINADRARLLKNTFAETNKIHALFWFSDRDLNRLQDQYGLVTYAGKVKPDYALFKQLLAEHIRNKNY